MTSFFTGVKKWLFGDSSEAKQQQQSDDEEPQHAGHKRTRQQHQQQRQYQEPVLREVRMHAGGVQGFDWFTSSLEVDADGDAAHGFITEQHTAGPGSIIGNGTHNVQGSSSSSSSLRDASSEHSQATAHAVPQKQQQFKVHGVRQGHLVVSHT